MKTAKLFEALWAKKPRTRGSILKFFKNQNNRLFDFFRGSMISKVLLKQELEAIQKIR
jgi:hypothetical protein